MPRAIFCLWQDLQMCNMLRAEDVEIAMVKGADLINIQAFRKRHNAAIYEV